MSPWILGGAKATLKVKKKGQGVGRRAVALRTIRGEHGIFQLLQPAFQTECLRLSLELKFDLLFRFLMSFRMR